VCVRTTLPSSRTYSRLEFHFVKKIRTDSLQAPNGDPFPTGAVLFASIELDTIMNICRLRIPLDAFFLSFSLSLLAARTRRCSSSRPMRPSVRPAKTPPRRTRPADMAILHQNCDDPIGNSGSSALGSEPVVIASTAEVPAVSAAGLGMACTSCKNGGRRRVRRRCERAVVRVIDEEYQLAAGHDERFGQASARWRSWFGSAKLNDKSNTECRE
jgi:hypothetical protein